MVDINTKEKMDINKRERLGAIVKQQ